MDPEPGLPPPVDDSDDDPITASYNVFLNPALPHGRRLLVLQQPNRTDDAPRPAPTEMRIKPHSGMIEVDLPLDNAVAYDREKGLRWGRALSSSMAAKNGGGHGLAGGFGVGSVQQQGKTGRGGSGKRRGSGGDGDEDNEEAHMDWNEAVRRDKVLRTQTLGGQYPDSDVVQYMVGVFQGPNLHLTPVSSLVHLRPQLHHLDAASQQERSTSTSTSKDLSGSGGGGSGVSGGSSSSASAARAIHMTIKNTADPDAVTTETMADRLRYVQTEHWRRLRYTDENEEAAWEVYNGSLFLRPEAKDGEEEEEEEEEGALEDKVPRLAAKWGIEQMWRALSRRPLGRGEGHRGAGVRVEGGKMASSSPAGASDEARGGKGARGGAGGGPAKRGSRGKTIQID